MLTTIPAYRKPPGHVSRDRRGGFALVIALALMAFVLLLVLSMTTLVRVETRSSEISVGRLAARQNALLSMRVALGNLQKTMGPDTRVSAPAARLDGDPSTPEIETGGAGAVAQPRWTGVWRYPAPSDPGDFPDGFRDGVDPRARPERVAWLVSGAGQDGMDPDPAEGPSGESVRLAESVPEPESESESESEPEPEPGDGDPLFSSPAVEVPLVRFDDGAGAYGYWVGDEGVKSKLNAVAGNYTEGGVVTPEATLLPLGNGASAFEALEGGLGSAEDWFPGPPVAAMELFLADRLGGGVEPEDTANELALHTTLYGHGVQSDTLRGGLKLDLSAIQDMDADTFADEILPVLPGDRIYESYLGPFAFGSSASDDGHGPVWDLLRQYWGLGTESDATCR